MDPAAWDERYSGADLVWSGSPNVHVADLVGRLTPGRALDVAAGEGRNAVWLAERGWRVVGADFSPVAVRRMRDIADRRLGGDAERLEAVVADATQPAPGSSFDLVLFCYLQLADGPWRTALEHGVDACAPGGTVVVVLHAERNLGEGVGGPQDASVLHDPDAVVAAVADLPVDVEVAEVRERVVDGAGRPALDTVVVLRRLGDPSDA
ncbi:class I SAM-dependent methyltransferase [Phycicoccus sp. BSK3Z-2]|uniref:Class I SAM-dependent methyltransferase n=1 Tax=Phycicoccus avicenniae TaxID=2828860 RepID=A0A941HZD2_9MICO|nr:class I SAM-dependent methyltransferase [Phycicoccus avicenniae]MBR7743963.1 class I SAM-dependent methyltransferase [Phycicoccus avicenniae]